VYLDLRQPTNLQSEQRAKKSECQWMVGNHQFLVLEFVALVVRRGGSFAFFASFLKEGFVGALSR